MLPRRTTTWAYSRSSHNPLLMGPMGCLSLEPAVTATCRLCSRYAAKRGYAARLLAIFRHPLHSLTYFLGLPGILSLSPTEYVGPAMLWAVEDVCFSDDFDILRSASSYVLERVVYVTEGGYGRLLPSVENSQLSCIYVSPDNPSLKLGAPTPT